MDNSARKIVAVRIAYDFAVADLRALLSQRFTFSDKSAIARVFGAALGIPLIAAAKGVGFVPDEMGEFIRRAGVQTAIWMLRQERAGIPFFRIAETAEDVGRHELLVLVQEHLARLCGPDSFAASLRKLLVELGRVEHELKAAARVACRRSRLGLRTPPSLEQIGMVADAISASFDRVPVDAMDVSKVALEGASQRIYELGSARYHQAEFFLPTPYLPSLFVADAAYYQFRHLLMSFVENTY